MKKNRIIYINGRFLSHKTDGISRFSLEICKQLQKLDIDFYIIVPKWLNFSNEQNFKIVKYGFLKSHFWEQIDLLLFLKKNGNPLLLNLSGLGPVFYKSQIITIHDLSFYENKLWFSALYTRIYTLITPILAKKALKIITVSEFSKREIIRLLGINEEKIVVVYNAVTKGVRSYDNSVPISSKFDFLLDEKFILTVASLDPRKNLQALIDSFDELKLDGYKLVLVGKAASNFNITLESSSANVFFTGFVSDSDLSVLYNECEFFVYISCYEGFGIPCLEAMSNGSAVLASDIQSLREVCADAALFVNPYDLESIKDGMLKMINLPDMKCELIRKGFIRSEYFSWEESGKIVLKLLRELIKHNESFTVS